MTKHYLGGNLVTFANLGGNSALLGSDQTLYVETTGDDAAGDGSIGAPFATLQRAFDEVPDGYDNNCIIQMGVGSFAPAVLHRNPGPNFIIMVVGDRSTPSLALSSPSLSLVSGRAARYRATGVGAHGGFAPSTHWMEKVFGGGTLIIGSPVADSVSDELDTPAASGFGAANVHPFSTTITAGQYSHLGSTNGHVERGLYFVGIDIAGTINLSQSLIRGCKLGSSVKVNGCSVSAYCDGVYFEEGKSSLFEAIIAGTTLVDDGFTNVSSTIVQPNGSIRPLEGANGVILNAADFDGVGAECIVVDRGSTLTFFSSVYCDPLRTRFLVTNGKTIRGGGALIAGSGVAGSDIVTLEDGAQAIDISTFLANVTGENMKVGDNASALISGITFPVTDLAATYPHMCRAT